jgi:F420-0:gamma-glutamyl ligase-like protein
MTMTIILVAALAILIPASLWGGFVLGRMVGISAERLKNTRYPSNAMLHNDKTQEEGPKYFGEKVDAV